MTARWVVKHILFFIVFTLISIVSFHIDALNITGIYFYDGIIRLLGCSALLIITEIIIRKKLKFDHKDIIISICLCILINVVWFSVCVIALDRSLSVFLLCYLDEKGTITEDDLNEVIDTSYVKQYRMLDRRLEEQYKSGNIIHENNTVTITEKGKVFVKIFQTVGKAYKVDDRFIEPKTE